MTCRFHGERPLFSLGRLDMSYTSRLSYGALLFVNVGCMALTETEKTAQVSPQFFESAPTAVARSPVPEAEDSLCVRVDWVGRKVAAANSQIRPDLKFATIQSPSPELFHVDQRVVYITDGLVKQLPTEADLAAVLAYEMARMVAEREARARLDLRAAAARPPIQLPIGGTGPAAATDMAATVEMAKYDQARRDLQKAPIKLDPQELARKYLEGAGYLRTDFDRVQPQLQIAERNVALERLVKGQPAPNTWSR
jgi:predicted Zn-dependent protease